MHVIKNFIDKNVEVPPRTLKPVETQLFIRLKFSLRVY